MSDTAVPGVPHTHTVPASTQYLSTDSVLGIRRLSTGHTRLIHPSIYVMSILVSFEAIFILSGVGLSTGHKLLAASTPDCASRGSGQSLAFLAAPATLGEPFSPYLATYKESVPQSRE